MPQPHGSHDDAPELVEMVPGGQLSRTPLLVGKDIDHWRMECINNEQVKGPAGIAVTAVLLIVFVLILVVIVTCLVFCGAVCLVAVSLQQRMSAREQLAESGVVVATW